MASTEDEKRQRLANYLNRQWAEAPFRLKRNRPISQSELARLIGVSQGSLSQWMTGTRLPEEDNRDKLAAYFGNEIYDILEVPAKIPPNKQLNRIVVVFGHLPVDVQKKLADMAEDEAEVWKERSTPKVEAAARPTD